MQKKIIFTLAFVATFFLGYAVNALHSKNQENNQNKRVTGIGGVFFKCKDPKKVRDWYQKHLGLQTNEYGAVFEWYQGADSTKKGFTQWSPFHEKTKYFAPSIKEFMINYRVEDLTGLLQTLKAEGVTVLDTIETVDYGKFAHILDIEGNKIELWEANDIEFEKLGVQIGATTTK